MLASDDLYIVKCLKMVGLFYSSKLVILTGAGISTESGIPDYRRLSFHLV